MSTRAAPSQQAVPMLARFVPARFAQRASLRPAVMLIAFFGAAYSLFATASLVRRRNDQDTSPKLHTMYLVLIILYALTAAVEAFGVAAVYRSSIGLVKAYFLASVVVAFVVTGAECTRLALHFTDKSAIISACVSTETLVDSIAGTPSTSDIEDINIYCRALWQRNLYWDFGLLIFSLLLSVLFASTVATYLQQLLNPALTRQHHVQVHNFNTAGSSQYSYPGYYPPAGAYPPNPYGQPSAPPLYQPGFVPAYEPNAFVANPEGEKGEGANPFGDRQRLTTEQREQMEHDRELDAERRRTNPSTETVTLEPRRGNEARV
ncbi:BZ3500_MvSof-1268-A1-R1_Chr3-1g05968 [Microbotryum saponariae]|uniref:BZ3500_MvSof-1268-A1-R1_Chr3-1g05968 protein n=1 Tax=Microbotryum saponariae TaxID=289078 RepID=A0A2X0L4H9_9BASI|nr:BZ3500_MvSof-1268-A1-R1_Chr3-1g05968 [Microbotryum saponariae]SDA05158.1 BZ3501_MvSof-1269-A2-R1_Chr3-1g05638 [Microbotryum saponariae]